MDIFDNLNASQIEAIKHIKGSLCVIAGAGTGKTTTIIHRIAYLLSQGIKQKSIVALSFTNKAVAEIKSRIVNFNKEWTDVGVFTFHTWCSHVLRINAERFKIHQHFRVISEYEQNGIIDDILIKMNCFDITAVSVCAKINRAKDKLINPLNILYTMPERECYKKYAKYMDICNLMDYGDLIVKTFDLLKQYKDVLNEVATFCEYLLIDEFQDTNKAQYELVELVSQKSGNLCVVGDDDQSIYAWRGTEIQNILEFTQRHNAKLIKLTKNYRSTPEILSVANTLIAKNVGKRIDKNLDAVKQSGAKVVYKNLNNIYGTGEQILKVMKEELTPNDYGKSIVLSRLGHYINKGSDLDKYFAEKDFPHYIFDTKPLYDYNEIKDIFAWFLLALNSDDNESFKRALTAPPRGIGETSIKSISNYATERKISMFNAITTEIDKIELKPRAKKALTKFILLVQEFKALIKNALDAQTVCNYILKHTEYESYVETHNLFNKKEIKQRIAELKADINTFINNNQSRSTRNYIDYIFYSCANGIEPKRNALALSTIHAVKGLEFDNVFIIAVNNKVMPHSYRGNLRDIYEERRLFHVAITRAKKRLYIYSHNTNFSANKRSYSVYPSPFISEAGLKAN
jgi:DNA helicase-2/ATP-dependent DNA helicase PcrA